jgi:hypothetical protein
MWNITDECDDEQARYEQIGKEIADMLMLKRDKNGRYETTWGNKTPLGLYLTLKRLIEEGGEKL